MINGIYINQLSSANVDLWIISNNMLLQDIYYILLLYFIYNIYVHVHVTKCQMKYIAFTCRCKWNIYTNGSNEVQCSESLIIKIRYMDALQGILLSLVTQLCVVDERSSWDICLTGWYLSVKRLSNLRKQLYRPLLTEIRNKLVHGW